MSQNILNDYNRAKKAGLDLGQQRCLQDSQHYINAKAVCKAQSGLSVFLYGCGVRLSNARFAKATGLKGVVIQNLYNSGNFKCLNKLVADYRSTTKKGCSS